jgi:hypothetical protein
MDSAVPTQSLRSPWLGPWTAASRCQLLRTRAFVVVSDKGKQEKFSTALVLSSRISDPPPPPFLPLFFFHFIPPDVESRRGLPKETWDQESSRNSDSYASNLSHWSETKGSRTIYCCVVPRLSGIRPAAEGRTRAKYFPRRLQYQTPNFRSRKKLAKFAVNWLQLAAPLESLRAVATRGYPTQFALGFDPGQRQAES